MANPVGRLSLDEVYIPRRVPRAEEDLSPLPSEMLARLSLEEAKESTPRKVLTPRREAVNPLQERVAVAAGNVFQPDQEMKDPEPSKGIKRGLGGQEVMRQVKQKTIPNPSAN